MKKEKQKKPEKKLTLKELKKEAREYLEGWKRTKADFENYKKDEKRRMDEFAFLLKADLILKILPILDSFEEALKSVPPKEKESNWVVGILKIKEQLENFLKQEEVKEIDALGKDFDPFYHEAVGEAVGKKEQKDKVIRVLQKGYKIGERVIRPARVYIGK